MARTLKQLVVLSQYGMSAYVYIMNKLLVSIIMKEQMIMEYASTFLLSLLFLLFHLKKVPALIVRSSQKTLLWTRFHDFEPIPLI